MFEIQHTEIHGEPVIRASFSGEFDRALALSFVDKIAAYEEAYPGHKLLVDCTAVAKVCLDFEDLKSIAQYVKDNDKRHGKTAFVTGADFGRYMLAKLYVDITSLFRPDQEKAFKHIELANEWLCPNYS